MMLDKRKSIDAVFDELCDGMTIAIMQSTALELSCTYQSHFSHKETPGFQL